MYLLWQHHQSNYQHQQQTAQTCGHKALTHASKTTMTTAAASRSKNLRYVWMQTRKIKKQTHPTAYKTRRPPTHTPTLHSTYHLQQMAHLHTHSAELHTQKLVWNTGTKLVWNTCHNTHHTGTHHRISTHSTRYYCRLSQQINCYQQSFYVQDHLITVAQKCTKTQLLYMHHLINCRASKKKDSLKPPWHVWCQKCESFSSQ